MKLTVTELYGLCTVRSQKGIRENMTQREHYGLSFCTEGTIVYTQNGKNTVSDRRTAVLLPKGGSYRINRKETGIFPVINFECEEDLGTDLLSFPVADSRLLFSLYRQMEEAEKAGKHLSLLSLFYRLAAEIWENGEEKRGFAADLIEKNLSDSGLTAKKIADSLYISESYFYRLFRKDHGESFRRYVIRRRMELAFELLKEDGKTVAEISEACGYAGVYSFSRTFKKETGESPAAYKKKAKKRFL